MKHPLITLRPRYLTLKNTWFHKTEASLAQTVRIGIFLSACLFVPNLVYLGIIETLTQLQRAPLAASYLIEILNFALLSILFFSNSVHALHTLFLSKDTDLLLAAPLSPRRLFLGKFTEILLTSSWVMIIFYLPALYAIGKTFHAPVAFYLFSLVDLIPLIVIPTALGIITSILFVRIYPARRVKELFVGASLLFVLLLHFSLRGHELLLDTLQQDLPALLSDASPAKIHAASTTSLHLLSIPLEAALQNNVANSIIIALFLLSIAFLCTFSTYRCFIDLYYKVYSSDTLTGRSTKFITRRKPFHSAGSNVFRAFAFKDYRMFLRDIAQPVQLILFLAMGIIAILGLRTSAGLGESIRHTQLWWDDLVVAFNIGLHALITILFSARFLFPSIAAEGEAGWILRSAPLTSMTILRTKFMVNLIPSLGILLTLLIAGCLVSNLSGGYIVVACIAGLINTCCISGISIGCGAYFSNMKGEHMGQITTGLGSFIFMLIALLIITFNGFIALVVAITLMILLNIQSVGVICMIGIVLLAMLHKVTVQFFLHLGQYAFER